MRQTFYKFAVAIGTLYFPLPCCHRLENRNFGLEIGFLTLTQLKKVCWAVQEHCQNQLAQYS